MKLKEIPLSLYSELKLQLLDIEKLKKVSNDCLPIIVSLSSIPSRFSRIHVTIKSILNQSKKPTKIILWLHTDDKKYVPKSLKELEGNIFSIQYTSLNSPHIKLIPSLQEFPNSIITTCDDDFIYDYNWLSSLHEEHLLNPTAIIANTTRKIQYDKNKDLLPYREWKNDGETSNKRTLAIGSSGVLYPPNSLSPIVTNSKLYLELAPRADDLWFKAMSLLNNTQVIQSRNPPKKLIPVMGTQVISLKKLNVDQNFNGKQWENLTEHFNLEL